MGEANREVKLVALPPLCETDCLRRPPALLRRCEALRTPLLLPMAPCVTPETRGPPAGWDPLARLDTCIFRGAAPAWLSPVRVEPIGRLKRFAPAAELAADGLCGATGNVEPSFQTPPGWLRIGALPCPAVQLEPAPEATLRATGAAAFADPACHELALPDPPQLSCARTTLNPARHPRAAKAKVRGFAMVTVLMWKVLTKITLPSASRFRRPQSGSAPDDSTRAPGTNAE